MLYYVEDFGALGNGITDDGEAIQKAIDACFENGGGSVVLSSGKPYYSHSVTLKSNVDLHFEKNAVLKASADIDSYIRPCEMINNPETALIGNPVTGKPSFVFIYGFEADNCSVTGEGTIDLGGDAFVERKSPYYVTGNFYPRPTGIYIENSKHITFKDITLTNAPFWTLHPAGCDDVLISNIRILNPLDRANSDGIDPDHSSNVRITGCHIECADDCICLKTTNGNREYGATENVIISDCTLISTSAALKIGTEGIGDFKNIDVHDCVISRSNRGISIQIRDGGNVENVSFSNISIETRRFCEDWWGTAEPIAITCFDRDENTSAGKISNIRFFNINCKGENGILVHATEKNRIENLLFENVNVTLSKSSKWPCGLYDLRPCLEYGVINEKNSPVYMRYADNVTFRNCVFSFDKMSEKYGEIKNIENCKIVVFE
ncbi:MAG: right-handed parallel beta-helix repeat-containing protein [Clostridiales bacterium]|nr:right-handed parallel beta-helix repeat-containing protein [Clostridiales bacterium]